MSGHASIAPETPPGVTAWSTPTLGPYLRLALRPLLWRTWPLIPFALMACACFAIAPLAYQGTMTPLAAYRAWSAALILPGMLVLMYATRFWSVRQLWKRVPQMREPRMYTFTGVNIQVKGQSFNSEMTWDHINKARRSGDHIVLGTHYGTSLLVPIAGFATPQHYAWFAALTAHKVRDCRL